MARGPAGSRIPTTVQNHLGDGKFEKGNWNGVYLIAWDFAEDCTGEKCSLYKICAYKKYWHMRKEGKGKAGYTSKCMLQQRYLKNVISAIMELLFERQDISKAQIIRVGYHIVPLYAQLFKFKAWEYGHHEIIINSKAGPKIHPVFKEIRDIIKDIESAWKGLGGSKKKAKAFGEIGDAGFVDAMYDVMDEDGEQEEEFAVSDEGTGLDFEEEVPNTPKKKSKKKKRQTK